MSLIERLVKLETERTVKKAVNVQFNKYGFLDILDENAHPYDIEDVPYLTDFLNDPKYPRKIIIGPYGSGKTSGILNVILRDVALMPKCDDGIRKARVAIIRNTMGQLETTTLNTWLFWSTGLPKPKKKMKPKMVYNYSFNDKDGEIRIELLFLALDSENAANDLDSLEVSHAFFNELRHIPKGVFDKVNGRLPRYPAKIEYSRLFEKEKKKNPGLEWKNWRPFEPKVYADTNPPKNRHWIQELEQKADEDEIYKKKLKVYRQPEALTEIKKGEYVINEEADNLNYVGTEYYLEMIERGEEYVKVYAQGKYGTVVDGKAIYQSYIDDIHSVENIKLVTNEMLYIGFDYGIVSPAILIAQCIGGQIRFIKEFVGEYETIETLAKVELIPFFNAYCHGMTMRCVGDPANTGQGRQALAELKIDVDVAKTNDIETRLAAVSNGLNEFRGGKPRILVSRIGCPALKEGFAGEYHYRRLKTVGEEKYVDTPNKTHPYSDVHDCAQYICMDILSDEGFETKEDYYYRMKARIAEDDKNVITGY